MCMQGMFNMHNAMTIYKTDVAIKGKGVSMLMERISCTNLIG